MVNGGIPVYALRSSSHITATCAPAVCLDAMAPCYGLQVVEKYTNLKPNNPLAKYLPALRSVAGKGDKFNGLDGIEKEISKLAKDEGDTGCYSPAPALRMLIEQAMMHFINCF